MKEIVHLLSQHDLAPLHRVIVLAFALNWKVIQSRCTQSKSNLIWNEIKSYAAVAASAAVDVIAMGAEYKHEQ